MQKENLFAMVFYQMYFGYVFIEVFVLLKYEYKGISPQKMADQCNANL